MSRKPKFRPRITRVKLNPEQAVLACSCWRYGRFTGSYWDSDGGFDTVCLSKWGWSTHYWRADVGYS